MNTMRVSQIKLPRQNSNKIGKTVSPQAIGTPAPSGKQPPLIDLQSSEAK